MSDDCNYNHVQVRYSNVNGAFLFLFPFFFLRVLILGREFLPSPGPSRRSLAPWSVTNSEEFLELSTFFEKSEMAIYTVFFHGPEEPVFSSRNKEKKKKNRLITSF